MSIHVQQWRLPTHTHITIEMCWRSSTVVLAPASSTSFLNSVVALTPLSIMDGKTLSLSKSIHKLEVTKHGVGVTHSIHKRLTLERCRNYMCTNLMPARYSYMQPQSRQILKLTATFRFQDNLITCWHMRKSQVLVDSGVGLASLSVFSAARLEV